MCERSIEPEASISSITFGLTEAAEIVVTGAGEMSVAASAGEFPISSEPKAAVQKTPSHDETARHGALWARLSCRLACIARSLMIFRACLLYTSDAADERSSVDLGGR